ncbi:MAG: PorT family protein [Prevotellaceae bacterium]|jgi:hypothetical protein|nr:PorT family protein [Prevotellaceae bacterium]
MRKKLLLVATLIAGVAYGAAAQEPIKLGVRAGLNFDNQTSKFDSNSKTGDSKVGFHLGGIADVPLANYAPSLPAWLYFQPGLYLTTKGTKSSETDEGYDSQGRTFEVKYTNTTSLYYLEVPLRALAKFTLTDDIKVNVNFGPAIGVAVSGKEKSEKSGGGQSGTETVNIFDDKDTGRFHFGLDFGGGIEYKQFYVGLGYDLGLSNMYTGDGDYSVKNSTFSINLGYSF